jgi:hypothetical protein
MRLFSLRIRNIFFNTVSRSPPHAIWTQCSRPTSIFEYPASNLPTAAPSFENFLNGARIDLAMTRAKLLLAIEFTEGHELDRKWRVPKEMICPLSFNPCWPRYTIPTVRQGTKVSDHPSRCGYPTWLSSSLPQLRKEHTHAASCLGTDARCRNSL